MRSWPKAVLTVVVALMVVLAACSPAEPTEPEGEAGEEGKMQVAMIGPGVISDQSWNEFGYEGLEMAADECDVEIAYSEDIFQDEQIETLRNYASQGYDRIIAHGGEYADSVTTVAQEYPDIYFGCTNGIAEGENVANMIIGYNQMAYLAGHLACEMTESNHIAFVGGEEIPALSAAAEVYREAAQNCGKDVQVDVVYTGDWADVTQAREAGLSLISDGVDVLWHILDTADAGLIAAAEDQGVYAIGLYRDSSDLGPDAVIGSAVGHPGTMIYNLACGNVEAGETTWMDVNTEAPGDLTPVGIHMSDLTPPEVQERLREVEAQMRSGEIEILNYGQEG